MGDSFKGQKRHYNHLEILRNFQIKLEVSHTKNVKIKVMTFTIGKKNQWLEYNDIERYSTNTERKLVIAERFIRTLKNKAFKCVILILKNIYFDNLEDIVNEYNNRYHRTIKIETY